MKVLPVTKAGAAFQLGTAAGKFQAVINTAGPIGSRTVMMDLADISDCPVIP